MSSNFLFMISPYWLHGTWVFDDQAVGLVQEPFVMGIPQIIDDMVKEIPDAKTGFVLVFAGNPFPSFDREINWVREEMGGNWYHDEKTGIEGWLCPALFKYFDKAPEKIYAKAWGLNELIR